MVLIQIRSNPIDLVVQIASRKSIIIEWWQTKVESSVISLVAKRPTYGILSGAPMMKSHQEQAAMESGDLDELLPPSRHRHASRPPLIFPSKPTDLASKAAHGTLSCVATIYAYVAFYFFSHRLECVLSCILVVCLVVAVGEYSSHRSARAAHDASIHHDWTGISSSMDLRLGKVDHWCLDGGDDGCRCQDPLQPMSRPEQRGWGSAHHQNVKLIRAYLAEEVEAYDESSYSKNPGNEGSDANWWEAETDYVDDWGNGVEEEMDKYDLDVVFVGDSITELRAGRMFGHTAHVDISRVFEKHFTKKGGGDFDGLALGLAGDTSPNLLWRLLNGEMPPDLNPKVWWVTIGTNDLLRSQCSEEVTLMGILRVVEEILRQKPDATVVINSILPLSQDAKGLLKSSHKSQGKKGGLNLWPSIKAINAQLSRFAGLHHRIKFLDCTEIFVEQRRGDLFLDQTLFSPDGIHPNVSGFKNWDKLIKKKLESIVQKKDKQEEDRKWNDAKAVESVQTKSDDDTYTSEYGADWDLPTDDEYWQWGEYGDDDGNLR